MCDDLLVEYLIYLVENLHQEDSMANIVTSIKIGWI